MYYNTNNGINNTAIGRSSMCFNSHFATSNNSTAFGYYSLFYNLQASHNNTAFGYGSLQQKDSFSTNNTAFGYNSLGLNTYSL